LIQVKAVHGGFSETVTGNASPATTGFAVSRRLDMMREIVHIDEELCDGCGLCIPSCHEGALQLVSGKARLVSDRLCDGLGACLSHCPRGAIKIEHRAADGFDEAAVAAHQKPAPTPHAAAHHAHGGGACPGSRLAVFDRKPDDAPGGPVASELTHWPVQLRLLPPNAPVLRGASLLIAADCVPVAYGDFQRRLLHGRAVLIGCPKFDDLPAYMEKLTEIMRVASPREVVVARMEVPCCAGIVAAVVEARRQAGTATPVTEVIIGTHGDLLSERTIPLGTDVASGLCA
jgi:ferredoxin